MEIKRIICSSEKKQFMSKTKVFSEIIDLVNEYSLHNEKTNKSRICNDCIDKIEFKSKTCRK